MMFLLGRREQGGTWTRPSIQAAVSQLALIARGLPGLWEGLEAIGEED